MSSLLREISLARCRQLHGLARTPIPLCVYHSPKLCRFFASSGENGKLRAQKRSICSTLVPTFLARLKMFTWPCERMILMQIAVTGPCIRDANRRGRLWDCPGINSASSENRWRSRGSTALHVSCRPGSRPGIQARRGPRGLLVPRTSILASLTFC